MRLLLQKRLQATDVPLQEVGQLSGVLEAEDFGLQTLAGRLDGAFQQNVSVRVDDLVQGTVVGVRAVLK